MKPPRPQAPRTPSASPGFALPALLLAFSLLAGCAATQTTEQPPTPPRVAGYAALYDLTSRNAGIANLLIFKQVDPPAKQAVIDFARQCADAAKQIRQFADDDDDLDLQAQWLTPIEQQTRQRIENATSTALLTTSGRDFQTRLLLSQLDAAEYGSHLAKTLAQLDDDDDRIEYLNALSARFDQMRQRLFKLLQPPPPEPPTPHPSGNGLDVVNGFPSVCNAGLPPRLRSMSDAPCQSPPSHIEHRTS
ncbi:MAG: hypothetical protein ACYC26_08805 [Phycisphaerales bacterium]